MDTKGETDRNAIIVGDFNTPLTSMDRSSKQKISNETVPLNDTLDQMDLTDIFRVFHPKAAEYTSFSSAHGTFSRIDNMLRHKTSLNKFKKIEIISSILSDHNAMNLQKHPGIYESDSKLNPACYAESLWSYPVTRKPMPLSFPHLCS